MELKKKTKKYNKRSLLVIFIILTIVLVLIVGYAYAKYVTSKSGNATAQVAKWSFDFKMLDKSQKQDVTNFAVTRTDNNTEVKDEMLAPGTSGEFILELNATNTETFLVYDTKITFTNKPTNLKFYTDNSKTQELVVENDKYLAFKGFMSLEDEKIKEQNVYWEWPLETGVTEEEIDENDLIDSSFMKKTMSMQIEVTGTQVMSNPYENKKAQTTINGIITPYDTVQEAINAVGTNQNAIVSILNNTQESISVENNQNLVLNMNGKTLTSENNKIGVINSGNLRITGNGTVLSNETSNSTIQNTGKLEIIDGKVSSVNYNAIDNNNTGELIVSGGTVEALGRVINCEAIVNEYVKENVIIKGNSLIIGKGKTGSYAIISVAKSKVKIESGTLKTTQEKENTYGSTSHSDAMVIRGELEMTGGTVETNIMSAIVTNSTTKAIIEGGILKGGKNTIWSSAGGTIIIGKDDGKVNKTSPMLIATDKIFYTANNGKIFLYDGIFKAKSEPIDDDSSVTIPEGYTLIKDETEGEYKISYLSKQE